MTDYQRIEAIIGYLDQHQSSQPSLKQLAAVANLSPFQLHRMFTRWAGVTPKAFLQCLTFSHAKQRLKEGKSVLNAALDSGLSSPSRLHDLCISLEAASPGEIKSGGHGWQIQAGIANTPFGISLLACSPRGICHLSFDNSYTQARAREIILAEWPAAEFKWNTEHAEQLADGIFGLRSSDQQHGYPSIKALVAGTQFQTLVWRALLAIPPGKLASYADIARQVGQPKASRAVGTAVGQNRLAFLIPCHRVIRQTGAFGNYRWGEQRKRAIFAWENATDAPPIPQKTNINEDAPKPPRGSQASTAESGQNS